MNFPHLRTLQNLFASENYVICPLNHLKGQKINASYENFHKHKPLEYLLK